MEIEGWILDVGVNGDYLEIWMKFRDGRTIPALYKYHPSFYAQLREELISFEEAEDLLNKHEHIMNLERCERYVAVTDHLKKPVLRIQVDSPRYFKRTIADIEKVNKFHLFNIDIPTTQTFFYEKHLFPMGLCIFELDNYSPSISPKFLARSKKDMPIIRKITLNDSNEEIFYNLPPLRVIHLKLGEFGAKRKKEDIYKDIFRRPRLNERLISCEIELTDGYDCRRVEDQRPPWTTKWKTYGNSIEKMEKLVIIIEEETEIDTITTLSKEIEYFDPDIVLTDYGDEFIFPYLVARASANNISRDLYLSRGKIPLKNNLFKTAGDSHYFSYGVMYHRSKTKFYFRGRIHIDTRSTGSLHFTGGNIYGTVEVARVSRVPIQRLTRITIGGALQSIQFYIAESKGYLVSPEKKNSEDFQKATTLLLADRGGHIFEPKIGVFERVGEFDYTSLYPKIMTNYNVSPDTINCECCKETGLKVPDLPFHTCRIRTGIVPEALAIPLEKRVVYKKLMKEMPKKEAVMFEKMNAALKWILVVSFGYLGFKNARFGRVEGHQSICAFAREIMLRSQEIAEKSGYRVLHGIVDSLWLQSNDFQGALVPDSTNEGRPKLVGITHFSKKDPRPEELKEFEVKSNKLSQVLQEEVNIPIELDAIYKFIVFLPSRQHPNIPVLNHYWAVTYDGKLKVRGVEIRRRDSPQIVKDAQKDILKILSSASGICEFLDFLPLAKRKFDEYCKRIDTGDVTGDELVIINRVSKKAEEYKVKSYQAVASERLKAKGIEIEAGQNVEYIIKNASSKSPNKRIVLRSEFEKYNCVYDKEKYKELLKRSFQNIIPFDYDAITDYDLSANYDTDTDFSNIPQNYGISGYQKKSTKDGLDRYLPSE
ncbi:MAG: hypothetical protein GY870_20200 [archaeon]|nr:hypothetical protein [archaeon]